jgi:hypothetical protein
VGRCDTRCLVEGEPLVLPPGVPPEQLCAPWAACDEAGQRKLAQQLSNRARSEAVGGALRKLKCQER